jgi:hypothetical protein
MADDADAAAAEWERRHRRMRERHTQTHRQAADTHRRAADVHTQAANLQEEHALHSRADGNEAAALRAERLADKERQHAEDEMVKAQRDDDAQVSL